MESNSVNPTQPENAAANEIENVNAESASAAPESIDAVTAEEPQAEIPHEEATPIEEIAAESQHEEEKPLPETTSDGTHEEEKPLEAVAPEIHHEEEKHLQEIAPEIHEEMEAEPIEDFGALTKEELCTKMEVFSKENDVNTVKNRVQAARDVFQAIFNLERDTALAKFLEDGGIKEEFDYQDPLEVKFFEAFKYFQKRRSEFVLGQE